MCICCLYVLMNNLVNLSFINSMLMSLRRSNPLPYWWMSRLLEEIKKQLINEFDDVTFDFAKGASNDYV